MTARHARRPADGAAWAQAGFPVDAPADADRVEQAAAAVAELCRFLAHGTHPSRRVLRFAPDAYPVLGSLAAGVHSLTQALRQVCDQLAGLAGDPLLRVDELGPPVDPTVLATRAAEQTAHAALCGRELAAGLDAAHAAIARLYHDIS